MEPISGIAVEIPGHVQRGEAARLFPVLSETSKEGRAASVLLATLSVVDTLADALLRPPGRPVGKRARIQCFTEVVLKSDPKFRPDGLLIVDSGRDIWSALVECKIGKAKIEAQQLENYLKKARENDIDCVLTISNELVADPRHPPVVADGRLTKSVGHFHYSWLAIRSEAEISYAQGIETDPEKAFILAELIRFLSHPSAGVEGFSQMPEVWPDVVSEIGANHPPKRSDPRLGEIADAWQQEEKELALILSRLVSRRCTSRSERRLRKEGYEPKDSILGDISGDQQLATDFVVPDAAAELGVCIDLRSRSTRFSMTVRAPEDRKRPDARLNWLLAQLKGSDPKDIDIVAHWPGRAKTTFSALSRLRDDPKQIAFQHPGLSPYAFEIVQTCHTPASFVARRRFVQDLEAGIQKFYGNIGRHLTAWTPKPPMPAEKTAAKRIEEDTQIDAERLTTVEQSLAVVLHSLGASDHSLLPATSATADEKDSGNDDKNQER
jgi:hypothetical protein